MMNGLQTAREIAHRGVFFSMFALLVLNSVLTFLDYLGQEKKTKLPVSSYFHIRMRCYFGLG